MKFRGLIALLVALPSVASADRGLAAASYGAAGAELAAAGTIALGGAYLASTRVDSLRESGAVIAAPFAGALVGGITFAIVHFVDDEGPSSTGYLLRYAGVGMLLGTAGSFTYAF